LLRSVRTHTCKIEQSAILAGSFPADKRASPVHAQLRADIRIETRGYITAATSDFPHEWHA